MFDRIPCHSVDTSCGVDLIDAVDVAQIARADLSGSGFEIGIDSAKGEDTASGPAPVPSNARTCGLPGPESLTLRNAPSMPTTLAANCISKAHVDPALIGEAKQGAGLTAEKSALFGPTMPMLEMVRGASPVLTIATGNWALFAIPTGCDPKFTFAELNDTLGFIAALGVISTTNASFSGGDCWQLAQIG